MDPRLKGRQERGRAAEDAAVAELKRRGWRLVERNYRRPFGEIDVIVRQTRRNNNSRLAFVEVRSRSGAYLADPLDSIDEIKQDKLRRIAEHWLGTHDAPDPDEDIEFIVIGVRFDVQGKAKIDRVIEDAF
jgi:putative endonuclease